MAQIVWTEPALNDLDAIADYIALENPAAAAELVRRVFAHVEQLEAHEIVFFFTVAVVRDASDITQ
jgi:plasmid stabilization system protein ParE